MCIDFSSGNESFTYNTNLAPASNSFYNANCEKNPLKDIISWIVKKKHNAIETQCSLAESGIYLL